MNTTTAPKEVVTNNTRLFRKIVRDHNERTGFKFTLPKDTDYSGQYAHPIHDDGTIIVTSQIDDHNEGIYATRVTIDGLRFQFSEEVNYERLKEVIKSEQFKYRSSVLDQLTKLRIELDGVISTLEYNVIDGAIADITREDAYDLAIRTAKELYRNSRNVPTN